MNIIKLSATTSTSTFLKELTKEKKLENFTVVQSDYQTNGRGQMNASWNSEQGKNLMFSVFVEFEELSVASRFFLSKVVSLAISEVLMGVLSSKINIKWPNDIMAERKKICGILIENSVKKTKVSKSIIGIGLNVNQEVFKNLPNATSMKLLSTHNFDLANLLEKLILSIKKKIDLLENKKFELIDNLYLSRLYKINEPAMFNDVSGDFMGKIIGVTTAGKLKIELVNKTINEYNLKEVRFLK